MNLGPWKSAVIMLLIAPGIPAASAAQSLLLEEIVILGTRQSPTEENLTMREVRESPARDMGEALKRVEGVDIVRKGAIANDLVLRGLQKDNINVLVDGMRLHGACPNRMDSASFHYDFAEVEQVQVFKGPYDLTNPGGMGGTVNAITKRPHAGFGGELSLTHGSYDMVNASAVGSYGGEVGDGLVGYAHKFSGTPNSGDGRFITDIYPRTSANRYRPDALDSRSYLINTAWTKLGWNPGRDSRMELGYSFQDARHVLYPYLLMDAVYDQTHRVNWTFELKDAFSLLDSLKVQAYWDQVDHLMDDNLRESSRPTAVITRPYSMVTDARTDVVGAKLSAALSMAGGTLSGGLDYYKRGWNAVNMRSMYVAGDPYRSLNMIPDASIHDGGFYAQYERPLGERWTIKGGARGDFARARAGSGNAVAAAGTQRDFALASANLQVSVTAAKGLLLYAGLGRGTRLPDQKELFMSIPGTKNTFGYPDLKATHNHEADLGARYSTDRFYVNGSIYYSKVGNFINPLGYRVGAVNNLTFENVNATFWGAESGAQVSLPLHFFVKAGLSYTEARNDTGRRPISEIPPLRGSAALRWDDSTFFVEAVENLTARQDRVDTSLLEAQTANWETTDLKAGVAYRGVSAYAGVSNLFDRHYYGHLSYLRDPFASGQKVPENGRNWYATLAYRF
ncbi:MAG: TonB-dependent receptor [Elusimicrobiota bacterium]|jgi:iron complex outermembrane receptor protein